MRAQKWTSTFYQPSNAVFVPWEPHHAWRRMFSSFSQLTMFFFWFYSQQRRMSGRSWCIHVYGVCLSLHLRYFSHVVIVTTVDDVTSLMLLLLLRPSLSPSLWPPSITSVWMWLSILLCTHARMRLHKLWIDVRAYTQRQKNMEI